MATTAIEPDQATNGAIEAAGPIPLADFVGQGTTIEMSRAVAQVQAMVLVAQRVPRSIDRARHSMETVTNFWSFADDAFWSFRRGGNTISGPSIRMAEELSRCWGNMETGIVELRRDDDLGLSEMQAVAWDLEANRRATHTFVVPHARDTTIDGEQTRRPLVSMRDIYENNANQASRRLRSCMFAVLPSWYVAEAVDRCRTTLAKGPDGVPIEDQRSGAVERYISHGVTVDRLEQKLGRSVDAWDGYDLAELRTLYKSIERNEISIDDAFPAARLTTADLAPEQPAEEPPATTTETAPPDVPEDGDPTPGGDPATGAELRQAITAPKSRDVTVPKALKALQGQFPDGGFADLDQVAADPQAVDWLMAWIGNGGKSEQGDG